MRLLYLGAASDTVDTSLLPSGIARAGRDWVPWQLRKLELQMKT